MSISIRLAASPDSTAETGNVSSMVSGTVTFLVQHLVSPGKTYRLTKIFGSGTSDADFYLYQDSSTIDTYRIDAAQRNLNKDFPSFLAFNSGTVVSLRVQHLETLSQTFTGALVGFEK